MMEYTNKYWKMIMPLVKKSLVKRFGKEETALLVQKTDAIYREMLNRSDDIGKDNPMASNLYECLIFLAVWKQNTACSKPPNNPVNKSSSHNSNQHT